MGYGQTKKLPHKRGSQEVYNCKPDQYNNGCFNRENCQGENCGHHSLPGTWQKRQHDDCDQSLAARFNHPGSGNGHCVAHKPQHEGYGRLSAGSDPPQKGVGEKRNTRQVADVFQKVENSVDKANYTHKGRYPAKGRSQAVGRHTPQHSRPGRFDLRPPFQGGKQHLPACKHPQQYTCQRRERDSQKSNQPSPQRMQKDTVPFFAGTPAILYILDRLFTCFINPLLAHSDNCIRSFFVPGQKGFNHLPFFILPFSIFQGVFYSLGHLVITFDQLGCRPFFGVG